MKPFSCGQIKFVTFHSAKKLCRPFHMYAILRQTHDATVFCGCRGLDFIILWREKFFDARLEHNIDLFSVNIFFKEL